MMHFFEHILVIKTRMAVYTHTKMLTVQAMLNVLKLMMLFRCFLYMYNRMIRFHYSQKDTLF